MSSMDMPPSIDINSYPLVPNPSGAPPNYVNPPTLEPVFLGTGITLLVLSGIFLVVRIIANIKHVGRLWFDDYLCIFAWITSVAYWVLFRTMVSDGTARHAWDIPISMVTGSYVKRLLAQQILGNVAMWAVKSCIFALYMRIFDSVRWMRHTGYSLIMIMAAFYLAASAVWIAFCVPRPGEKWGTKTLERTSYPGIAAFVVAPGVFGLVIDLVLFALPFPLLAKLHLPTSKKLGILFVFAVAFCTVVAACVSLAYRVITFQGVSEDPTWVGMHVCMASSAEQFGTVIVSCAPAASSFWKNVCKTSQLFSSIQSKFASAKSDSASTEHSDPQLHRFAFQKYNSETEIKTRDPYSITEFEIQSKVSSDDISSGSDSDRTRTNSFITSTLAKPVEGSK